MSLRRALIVGIDNYPYSPLFGCVSDALKMNKCIRKNDDGSPNFDCKVLTAPKENITRSILIENICNLFKDEADTALFYFSGHGTENNLDGYIVTQDAKKYNEGVSMSEIITMANDSHIGDIIIILDSCHSGALGNIPLINNKQSMLREGISILTASRSSQNALENSGGGLFTSLVIDALRGGAADVCGNITSAAIYAYVDQAFGAWEQRPLFKAHVSRFNPIRKCNSFISLSIIRKLPMYFPNPEKEFVLDPSFEPTKKPRNKKNEAIFADLQKLRDQRLVIPIGEEHMYYAALNSKSCRLTPLGKYYWHLVSKAKI
jgi:hypothetical protein